MINAVRCRIVGPVAFVALALGPAHARGDLAAPIPRRAVVLSATESRAVAEFEERLAAYLALHRKLEAALPKLPNRATPEEVEANRRSLGARIREARATSKPGELFTPEMRSLVRRTLKAVVSGPDAASVKASIMDENPGGLRIGVNERYPDAMPLSTMPPAVLESLPKLEAGLEYRFVGARLVLMDSRAQIIVDFTDEVLPWSGRGA